MSRFQLILDQLLVLSSVWRVLVGVNCLKRFKKVNGNNFELLYWRSLEQKLIISDEII